MGRSLNITMPLVQFFINIKSIGAKVIGILTASLYTLVGSYLSLQSFFLIILRLINIIIIALMAIIAGLIVANVFAFGALSPVIAINTIILGLITMFLGIIFLFSEKFYRSYKPNIKTRTGLIFAPFIGFAFGIGWTPCIGPTLGAVQVLAFESATAQRGAILSAAYCVGLGFPFILMGLLLDKAEPFRKLIARNGNLVTKVGGSLLILIGLLQVSNLWDQIMNSLRDLISGFIPVI